MWIGTLAGLARFDGMQFKVFTPQNCPELPRSRIGRLFEGADGTLFITTERGGGLVALSRFHQQGGIAQVSILFFGRGQVFSGIFNSSVQNR
jgi:ligand-binding sensor domain-containing protein